MEINERDLFTIMGRGYTYIRCDLEWRFWCASNQCWCWRPLCLDEDTSNLYCGACLMPSGLREGFFTLPMRVHSPMEADTYFTRIGRAEIMGAD